MKIRTISHAFCLIMVTMFFASCAGTSEKSEMDAESAADAAEEKKDEAMKEKEAKEATASEGNTVTCKIEGDTRVISVNPSGEGCEVLYTKQGEEKSIASAVNGTSHCEQVRDRVKSNLEAAGFSCEN